jgi:hypothetical protein
MSHSDSEDIWAESDDEGGLYERNLAEREWERLQEDHGNVNTLPLLSVCTQRLTLLLL